MGELLVVNEIKAALEKRVGHPVPKTTVYRMLHRHGWRKIHPRRRHPKQVPEVLEDFKKGGFAKRGAAARPKGKPLRIMFQDEARIGRISDPRACWAKARVRPIVGAQMIREYVYIFGAVCPQDGQHGRLILPWANARTMSLFLEEVGQRHPDEPILMFLDQAGWHKAAQLTLPENIELGFLPPDRPELDPQEYIRDEIREKYLSNRLFKSLQAVINAAADG
jgi:hypothetical protein